MEKKLTVVIPNKEGQRPYVTLRCLASQTFQDFDIVIVDDKGNGAQWARNKGFGFVKTEYVLFSDNDIEWYPDALENLVLTLERSDASYSYGAYELGGKVYCDMEFDPMRLRKGNYISTMSVMRTEDFPRFDESIKRLQDYDLWLTMLGRGKVGKYCGKMIFSTEPREGITTNSIPYDEAFGILKVKHNL